jgi:ribosome-binding factor A
MDTHRAERVSEAIREELGEIISYELSDPRIGDAVVTEVLVSPDKGMRRGSVAKILEWNISSLDGIK